MVSKFLIGAQFYLDTPGASLFKSMLIGFHESNRGYSLMIQKNYF